MALTLTLLVSCKSDSSKEIKKQEQVNNETSQSIELKYAIDQSYEIGDVRRYGIFPEKGLGNHPVSGDNSLETVLKLAESEGITLKFPKGYYKYGLSIVGKENITMEFDDAVFGGPINIMEKDGKKSSDIQITGRLTSYFRFFVRNSEDILVEDLIISSNKDKNIAKERSYGCDIYAGAKNIYIQSLTIEDMGSDNDTFKRARAALQVHGWNNNPEYLEIEKLHIKSSDRHGVYLTGNNHVIHEVSIDKFGVGNINNIQDLDDTNVDEKETFKITGLWLNKCNDCLIGSAVVNTNDSKGEHAIWLDEGDRSKPSIINKIKLIGGEKNMDIYVEELSNAVIKKVEN